MEYIQIRPAILKNAEQITLVHVQSWQQSYRSILPSSFLDTISHEEWLKRRRAILEGEKVICLVAELENSIIGFCDAGAARGEGRAQGEVYALYLLETYKRQGVGEKLFFAAKQALQVKGLLPFIVWVFKENISARNFYEKQSGVMVDAKMISVAGQYYEEVCYFFD